MIRLKFSFITGRFPKAWPINSKGMAQIMQPKALKAEKRFMFIRAIPATKGASVRMIGRKRESTMASAP